MSIAKVGTGVLLGTVAVIAALFAGAFTIASFEKKHPRTVRSRRDLGKLRLA